VALPRSTTVGASKERGVPPPATNKGGSLRLHAPVIVGPPIQRKGKIGDEDRICRTQLT
jgi:hypothetical protein